jgi:hypothetical protein
MEQIFSERLVGIYHKREVSALQKTMIEER